MTTCKEESSIDYVCNLLDDEQITDIEEHLRICPDCAREIASWEHILRLTEAVGTVTLPDLILDNIEMKVYKRLAAESPPQKSKTHGTEQKHFFSRFVPSLRHAVSHRRGSSRSQRGATWAWRGAVVTAALAMGILIATTFFDKHQSPDIPLTSTLVQSPGKRLEQYRQQEIQRSFEDAVEAKHLKEDDWAATGKLRLLREQAKGTPWAGMANNQLQITYTATKEGI